MKDHEGKAREISSSSRCVNCQEISQYDGDPCCDYPMRITLITGDDLVSAIASALREAEAGEREACAKLMDAKKQEMEEFAANPEGDEDPAEYLDHAALYRGAAYAIRSRSKTDE